MNTDGVSYLEMASEMLRRGPSALINGLWSPAYPALIGVGLALFHPSPHNEFPVVAFVTFLTFVLDLMAFRFFLKRWQLYMEMLVPTSNHETPIIVPFAFCTFLLFSLHLGGIRAHPDFFVAAIVFLAAGIACRLSLPGATRRHYVALGSVLGLGYYAKFPLLLLSVIFMGGLFLRISVGRLYRRNLILSLSVFLVTAALLTALLSRKEGHLSIGDSGALNYAWHVNGRQPYYFGWTGADLAQFAPNLASAHPPRRLMEKPLVLEFGMAAPITFPLWYDPGYWYSRVKPRFNLRQQIVAFRANLRWYVWIFITEAPCLPVGAIILLVLGWRKGSLSAIRSAAWLLTLPIAALSMYALVHIEMRYVTGFCTLLFVVLYGSLIVRADRQAAVAICAAVAGTMMVPFLADLANDTAALPAELMRSTLPAYEKAALDLRGLGLQGGDRIAVVGDPFSDYYAHYDRLRIVAAIPAENEFWKLSPQEQNSIEERLAQFGVKAVVTGNEPRGAASGQWRHLESGQLSVLMLPGVSAEGGQEPQPW